jgi:DNA-binding CsgD family transcriptional regulator/tetratricopeptide (TPR) repeat protein
MMITVEDLHWSDEESLELLYYFARRIAQSNIALVLSYRNDASLPHLQQFLASLERERLAQEWRLSPLTPESVEIMIQAVLALPSVNLPDLYYAVYPLSEGNPFFLEELLKSLALSGYLSLEDQRWMYRPGQAAFFPRSIRTVVQQRLTLLSEPARTIIHFAAVAGRRFSFMLLQYLTPYQETELLTALKELMAARFIEEESGDQFRFRHALIQHVIVTELLIRERQTLHRLIAEALEHVYADTIEAHWSDLAHHYFVAAIWSKALTYGWQAGEKALQIYAPHVAIEQFSHALEAAQKANLETSAAIVHQRGQSYAMIGDFTHALQDYEVALIHSQTTQEHDIAWHILLDLGALWTERDYQRSGAYYQEALTMAQQQHASSMIAHSLNALGNWYVNLERPQEALARHQQAERLFEAEGDLPGLATTMDLLGLAAYLQGNLAQGMRYFMQAESAFRRLDDRVGLASCLANQVTAGGIYASDIMVAVPSLSQAEAVARGEEALRIARAMDNAAAEAYALCTLGQRLGAHGEYGQAIALTQNGLNTAQQIEHQEWMAFGHWTLGKIYLDLLDPALAQLHLEHALALAQAIGSRFWIRVTTALLARAYLAQRDIARTKTLLLTEGEQETFPETYGQQMLRGAWVELALATDQSDQATELIAPLLMAARSHSSDSIPASLLLLQADVLLQQRKIDEAEILLQAGLIQANQRALFPLQWRIHLRLGRLYRTQRRQVAARQALSRAREIASDLATRVDPADLRATFLAAVESQLPKNRPFTPHQVTKLAFGGLTEREREVARLIADGKTNPDIARHLVIGKRTVETYVRSIRSKLGTSARTQIALWVREHDRET